MTNKDFNYEEFKDIIKASDIAGLEYLYNNEIQFYNRFITQNDYIYSLYSATMFLNNCNDLHEHSDFENNFEFDLYAQTRNKLLEELGLNVEELYN